MRFKCPKLKLWQKLLLFAAAACVVAASYGLERAQSVEFVCTNGDYQNYNVLRRFLAGQTPYVDFANYLGMGVLWVCGPLLALHNTFAGSLFVTNFVSVLTFILLVTLVFYLVTGNKAVSALAGLLFPKLLSSGLLMWLPGFGYYTTYYLEMLLYPKNSFRSLRMFLPVLLCWLLLLALRQKKPGGHVSSCLRRMVSVPHSAALLGFVLGVFVTWSNDFGFACIGAGSAVFLILTAANAAQGRGAGRHKAAAGIAAFFAALALGAALSILLASGGHPGAWLAYTRDVGSWQFWYFGIHPWDKILTLSQLFNWEVHHRTLLHWMLYAAAMGICLYRLCRQKENDRLILAVFLVSSVVAGQLVYIFGSGGDNFEEGTCALAILFFWAFAAKAVLLLAKKLPARRWHRPALLGLAACYLVYAGVLDLRAGQQLLRVLRTPSDRYLAELEGNTPDAQVLREMAQKVGTEPFFATYATAVDDMRGTFQPTGSDYIIHALGDTRFAEYVRCFDAENYPWAQTINAAQWAWEGWVRAASWPLYRELLASYRHDSDHVYWSLWQYAGEDVNVLDVPVKVQLVQNSDSEVEIRVTSPEKRACYVDVAVDWQTDMVKSPLRLQTFRSTVFVTDPAIQAVNHGVGEGYFRPTQGQQHLGIYMCEGQGSICLTGMPQECTALTVREAKAGDVILAEP